jgi:putative transposase
MEKYDNFLLIYNDIEKQVIHIFMNMKLSERHIINKSDERWKFLDNICFLSKNLYNSALYFIKKHKEKTGKFIRYNELEREFKWNNQPDYKELPNHSSQQTLMLVDKCLTSYFKLLSKYKKDKKSLSGCPKFPKYKDKIKGRFITVFTIDQAKLKNGYIHFPKKSGLSPIKTNVRSLKQVRIIPQSSCYVIEVVYEKQEKEKIINNHYLSIDLGINNLMACYDTKNNKSFIINGRPLKSINQFYNKKKSKLQSKLFKDYKKYNSNRINRLTQKRNNKITDYLHKSSRFIVDYCTENQIGNIIVGYNKEWKNECNIGNRNNQNFVQIPHRTTLNMLSYKSLLEGINYIENEESYTSKCSALDLEPLNKQENYLGKRVKRGLFISLNGTKINADLNGALNILRKVSPDKEQEIVQTQRRRGQVIWPLKVNL